MIRRLALLSSAVGMLACQHAAALGLGAARAERCGGFATHAEEIACRDRIAAASRTQMLAALAVNRRHAAKLDAEYAATFPKNATDGHRRFVASLNASQAAWERYAEAQCHYEADKNFGGSGGWDRDAECKDRLNRQRLAELKTLLAKDREDGVISPRK